MMKYTFLVLLHISLSFVVSSEEINKEIPRDTTFTVEISWNKIKKDFPEARPVLPNLPEGVRAEYDLVYTTLPETPFGKRELHVDIFRPEKPGKYPALIMVHGGGWRAGDKSLQVPMAQQIASLGFVTVAVEYQLSLEAKYPAAIHNIKAAIRWMRANAEKYNIDPDKIAISGCSAGGHLASLVGLTNGIERFEGDMGHEEFSSDAQAIIDIDGVINFMAPLSLKKERKPDSPDAFWLSGTFYTAPGTWKEASPIYWANEESPPIMILKSGFPRFAAGHYELTGMYEEWDIYHEVHLFDVKVHPFWLFHPWFDKTVNLMTDYLDIVFKP